MDSDDGQNQKSGDTVAHADLNPDQPVSLRESTATELRPVVSPTESPSLAATPVTVAVAPQSSTPSNVVSSPTADVVADVATVPSHLPSGPETSGEPAASDTNEISWTASEFIAHPKSLNWYLALVGITVVIVVLAYIVNHDIITAIAILTAAGLFGYMAGRQPRQLEYSLGTSTINIGAKSYPYKDFNAYSIIQEGPFSSIDFMPLKRFAPILSIYYDPGQEQHVMEVLNGHLPFTNHKRTAIDNLMHRIRF